MRSPALRPLPFLATVLATLAGPFGCGNPTPGTVLGTYAVASALSADTCGSIVVASADPGPFTVTISNDRGVYYWFPSTGGTSTSGSMNAARTVTIDDTVVDNVDGTDAGVGPCTLQRNDALRFTLAAGASPGSFTGSYGFTMMPAAGSTCTDQLAAHGGSYAALPCTITYALTGKLE